MITINIILISLCLWSHLIAQDNSQQLISAVQGKYDKIHDLTADFTQGVPGKNITSGKFYFKKKEKLRIEFNHLFIITDGKTTWNFNKKDNKVIISTYDESDPFALSIQKLVYEYPANCYIKDISQDDEEILYLTPKNSSINFKSITLWIGDDNLIDKVLLEEPSTGSIEIAFSGYKINTGHADSKFSFKAPEGSTIIDLR